MVWGLRGRGDEQSQILKERVVSYDIWIVFGIDELPTCHGVTP